MRNVLVHGEQCAVLAGQRRNRSDVGQEQRGVRGRFHEDESSVRSQGFRDGVEIRRVDERRLDPERRQHFAQEPHGAAVDDVRAHDVVAAPARGERQRGLGGQAGREGDRRPAALDGAEVPFESGDRRIAAAAVRVAAVHADLLLHERRRLIDGGENGSRLGLGVEATVNAAGREVPRELSFVHALLT